VAGVEGLADVLLDESETRFVGQAGKVGCASGGKIIHTDHMMTLAKQCVAQMRAEEAGGAGDQDTLRDTLSRQDTGSACLKVNSALKASIWWMRINRTSDVRWESLPSLR
jgi:hypothetical protein